MKYAFPGVKLKNRRLDGSHLQRVPEVTTVKRVTPKKKNKRISTTKSVVTTSRQMTTSYDDDEEEDELPASTTAITIRKEIK